MVVLILYESLAFSWLKMSLFILLIGTLAVRDSLANRFKLWRFYFLGTKIPTKID
jgi:hypothetical protein